MSQRNHVKWLVEQLPQWINEQLISQQQAAEIANWYTNKPVTNVGRIVFSSLGAILVGLGVILFFAYNWQEMHRYIKLLLIFSAIIVVNIGSLWYKRDLSQNRSASEGLALLGTMLFGAAIWLISQIYHIDDHYPNAFVFWGVAALMMGWARTSFVQGLAALVLLGIWGFLEIIEFGQSLYSPPWLVLFGVGGLAWRLRSKWLSLAVIAEFYFLLAISWLAPLDDVIVYVVFTLAILFISSGMLLDRFREADFRVFRVAFLLPGFAVYLGLIYGLTFVSLGDEMLQYRAYQTQLQTILFWCAAVISIVAVFIVFLPIKQLEKTMETDVLHSVLLIVTAILVFLVGSGWVEISYVLLSGVMNLIFVGHCLLFILHGSREQRGWEVAVGCGLFSVLVFARYTDLFDSLLSRALVFLVLGCSLFLVGNFYSRYKRDTASSATLQEVAR
jgi:uncharacterized membrane protein